MSFDLAFLPLLAIMAAVSFASRAGGFWLMRFVPVNPGVEAALKATPLAVMVGIVTPAAARGNWPEISALAVLAIVTRLTGNDLLGASSGVLVVGGMRYLLG